jgi:hypothetical protein
MFILAATALSADEAQVRETRTEGPARFDHSVSSVTGGDTVLSFIIVSVATTVVYDRISGDPLTVADAQGLAPSAYICDGPEMRNQQSTVSPDQIVFTYDCIRPED